MAIWNGLASLVRDVLADRSGRAEHRATAAELRRLFADDLRDHEAGPQSGVPDSRGPAPRR